MANRQMKRQKKKSAFKYSSVVINIQCDVIVGVNHSLHENVSVNKCFASWKRMRTEQPRLEPSGLFHLGSTATACLPLLSISRRRASERSPANLLGADWSRLYWSGYRTIFSLLQPMLVLHGIHSVSKKRENTFCLSNVTNFNINWQACSRINT